MSGRIQSLSFLFFLFSILFLNSGCYNTRFLKKGEVLFKANRVEIISQEKIPRSGEFKRELAGISQLQPNKKFIGVAKVRLWFYNVSTRRKQNKFRDWMRNKVGEAPVFYDSLLAEKSIVLLKNYLVNKGYFYAEVTYSRAYKDFRKQKRRGEHKTATLIFHVKTNDLYRIRNVSFPTDSSAITRLVNAEKKKSFLKPGAPFDVGEMKKERERISDILRNNGYYFFNREYVYFDLDSSMGDNELDLMVRINPPADSTEHKVYSIDQIYVITDYSADKLKQNVTRDTVDRKEFHFISQKLRYRPRILISAIHFGHDSLYRKKYHTQTIGHLSNLGVFKYITMRYADKSVNGKNYLDCFITLSPAKKQQVGIEFEANNNTDFNLGTSLTLSYSNKNIFRGTELFRFSVSGGFESDLERGEKFFNTVDLLFKFDLFFNRFLVPRFIKTKISKNAYPKTRISFRNEFQRRIDYYSTNTTTFALGYEWRMKNTRRFTLNIPAINLIRNIEATPQFLEIVNSSPSLRNSFTQQLILGWDFNYIWSNQPIHKGRSYWYYSGKLSSSGNVLHLGFWLAHRNDGKQPPYEVFNVEYSQFFLVDSEMKNYFQINKKTQLVTRVYGGIGVPYGNSQSLAYIKQFFSGGANSMRGWRIRAVGPGTYNYEQSAVYEEDNFFYDQTGEIKFEANAEYRFDVYKFFKAALFLDMGNIWIIQADTARPGANFDIGNIWTDLAIGTGVGARLDFGYFVLRFDVGVKVREPAAGRDKWPIWNYTKKSEPWRRENMRFNLAIGYPF